MGNARGGSHKVVGALNFQQDVCGRPWEDGFFLVLFFDLWCWQAVAEAVESGKAIVGIRRSKWDVRKVVEVVAVAGAQVAVVVRTN